MEVQPYRGGILTTNGLMVWIDEQDYDWLSKYRWYREKNGRITRSTSKGHFLMHREILGLGPGDPPVDHINGKPYDNQRSNLRIVDASKNQWNREVSDWVFYDKDCPLRPWVGKIMANNKQFYTNRYASREDAVEAKKQLKIKLHGEFVRQRT